MSQSKSNLKRSVGRYLLISLRWIVNHVPYPVYRLLTWPMYMIGRAVMANKKNVVLRNLDMAYGSSLSEKERSSIAERCFRSFGKGMIELIYYIDRAELIKKNVRIEGQQHLDDVLKKGKGAILVGAHFGSFILMYMRVLLAGYKTSVIMKRTRDPEFEKYISEFRNQNGLNTIYDLPPRQCVQGCIKALRNNEVLFILLDQNYGSAGRVFVDFFGKSAATATGPYVFAQRTGAAILPIFIASEDSAKSTQSGGRQHVVTIQPPVQLIDGDSAEDSVVKNIQNLTHIIENQIRKTPHEWGGWMHKRWKTVPLKDEQKLGVLSQKS